MRKTKRLNNKGIASIEAVAMMVVFVLLMAYGIGVFGVIHTGILNSIAARTYAWETFNHRANVNVFRDNRDQAGQPVDFYIRYGFRVHSVSSEFSTDEKWIVTERKIAMGTPTDAASTRNTQTHNQLNQLTKRERVGVNPVWIKTLYGICMDSECRGVSL